jgi:hypothetical protein
MNCMTSGKRLGRMAALTRLDAACWAVSKADAANRADIQRCSESAAMLVTARLIYGRPLARPGSHGKNRRVDFLDQGDRQGHYVEIGGLDDVWTSVRQQWRIEQAN